MKKNRRVFEKKDWGLIYQVSVELRDTDSNPNKPCLSICGTLWEGYKNDDNLLGSGQCLDAPLFTKYANKKSPLLKRVIELWKNHHLNDLHAGTVAQEDCLKEFYANGGDHDYYNQCAFLESKGLLVDDGYKYGTGWQYREIPANDLADIKKILSGESWEELDKYFA